MIAGPLRLFSVAACLVIALSWALFATNQARDGSDQSRAGIDGLPAATVAPGAPVRHSAVRRRFDKVAHALRSPFDGLVAASGSQWVKQSVPALLALLVYGFGCSYLARAMVQRN